METRKKTGLILGAAAFFFLIFIGDFDPVKPQINTMAAMAIDINTQRPLLSHGSGGLSGNALHPIAVKMVYDLYKVLKIPIIGCGGISTWKDVIEFFLAGCSAIQIGTILYQGFHKIDELKKGVVDYLKQNNYNSISELKGLAHKFNTQEVPDFD